MIPLLASRVDQARRAHHVSREGAINSFGWIFAGTLVTEMAGEVWRQTHGGVGYVGDFSPWAGLAMVALPALGTKHALHDVAVQRFLHAFVACVVAMRTPAALAHYESLSRDAHTGMGHMRTPTVYATSAAFALVLVAPLFARAHKALRRVVPALALALALASLAVASVALSRRATLPEAASLLRGAPVVGTLPPPETWPATTLQGVQRAGAVGLPFALDARCERWYCDLRGGPVDAEARAFPGHWYPSLLRDRRALVRRAGAVWVIEQPTGEVSFLADGRYASYATVAAWVRPPDAWVAGALAGGVVALVLLAWGRARRRRMTLDASWFVVTIQRDGTAVDAQGHVYAVDVAGQTPPVGPAYARVAASQRAPYREGATTTLREVLPGDAATLGAAFDAWLLASDARALAAVAWGGGSLAGWVVACGVG